MQTFIARFVSETSNINYLLKCFIKISPFYNCSLASYSSFYAHASTQEYQDVNLEANIFAILCVCSVDGCDLRREVAPPVVNVRRFASCCAAAALSSSLPAL